MTATRKELFERFDTLGIQTRTVEHPAVFTVAESDELHRQIPGGHTKNLFLKDAKGVFFLVIAECHTTVNLKVLHKNIGCARLSFGKPDLMREILGVEPGSVTALGVINDSEKRLKEVIIDENLMAFDTINCHPLINTATTSMAREDLFNFIRVCGHEPRIMSLSDGQKIS